ncbi:MAG TPA: hypothetical protein VH061_05030 [Solirubrobacteraceae bacterium]|jgi:hypothetical protein|nr:hypothetical protein [Solirubrobacteraceae bacterium]
MIHNHHIAAQLAAERQRDLLAAGRGWRFSDLFGRRGAELEPVAPAEATQASAGDDAIDATLPSGVEAVDPAAPRRPELRIRRTPAASRRGESPRPRERRAAERTGS